MPHIQAIQHSPFQPSFRQDDDIINPGKSPIDPGLSLLISFLLPGLTQIILGQTSKGLLILIGTFLICSVTLCIGFIVICPIAMIDGYKLALKLQRGQSIKQWEWSL